MTTLGMLTVLAAAPGASPLDHVVQHPIQTLETRWGSFTLLSDHITMILAAGLLLAGIVAAAMKVATSTPHGPCTASPTARNSWKRFGFVRRWRGCCMSAAKPTHPTAIKIIDARMTPI